MMCTKAINPSVCTIKYLCFSNVNSQNSSWDLLKDLKIFGFSIIITQILISEKLVSNKKIDFKDQNLQLFYR